MTYVIPLIEPRQLLIGDTWEWQVTNGDYPANLWTLTYYFKKHDYNFSIVAGTSNLDFLVNVPPATNGPYRPGIYRWISRVVDGTGNTFTWLQGQTELLPDPSTVGNHDFRTTAAKIVKELEQLALRRSGGRHQVSIDGILMVFDTHIDIIKAKSYWEGVLENEQNADRIKKGLGSLRTIRVRM
jgi:hypothetical protein